jgi:hypothetical protein
MKANQFDRRRLVVALQTLLNLFLTAGDVGEDGSSIPP